MFISLWMFVFADFYNWNRVKVRYCDGGSFSGDSENKVSICIEFDNLLVLHWLLYNYFATN